MNKLKLIFLFSFLLISYFIFKNHNNDSLKEKNFNKYNMDKACEYPSDWEWIQRTFPYYQSDTDAYKEALNTVEQMKNLLKMNKTLSDVQWQFAGPDNIGGRVVDIEFNPVDANIVYAGAATGGVYKSTDKGQTWFPVFDNVAMYTIGDIAVDPSNPNIIYVGTGESNGGHNNFPGNGVYKSTDGGNSWTFKGLGNSASIGRIIIDPNNTQIIYLAAVGSYFSPNPERGVYKSTDGGTTWNQSLFVSDSTGAIDIVMDPANPSLLLAAMWERVRRPNSSHLYGPSSGIYKTTNGGGSWTLLGPSTGLPDANSQNIGRIGLAISQSNPNIFYALYNDGTYYTGLYKTTNYGNNWTNADPNMEIAQGTSNFSWYFGQVRIDPADPNRIFALDVSFMRSTNGGSSWPIIYGYTGPPQLHVDHHALAFAPDDHNYILSGNDGGINISTDGGVTWSAHANLPVTQFYEIGLDYNNPQKLYGGTQDNGTNRTQTGNVNDWQNILGGDGFYVVVDFTNPNIIFAEYQNGQLYKSTDGGSNFNWMMSGISDTEKTNWSTPVIMDPNDHNVLYYGTNHVYRTTNAGQSWSSVSPDLTNGTPATRLGTITTIAVAPSNSNVIYAGTDDSNVWVTSDHGNNWTQISASLPYRWVTRVVVNPSDENKVYVTFSGLKWHDPQPHVFKSSDMGSSWTDISSNLPDAPVDAFAVDNHNPDILYLGNDVGAFVSFNDGAVWYVLGSNLPAAPVNDMKIHPVANYLAIGTHGRSMYKLNLDSLASGINDIKKPIVDQFELFQNYPNPFNPSTVISYRLSVISHVSLKVYDVLGREIATLINEVKSPGKYNVRFHGDKLSSGVYLYNIKIGNFVKTRKMILMK